MAIENIAVWPFEADWGSSVVEAYEWLTSILVSPKAAEQRRTLRLYPRRTIEFSTVQDAAGRAAIWNFVETYGAQTVYLPLWHESYRTTAVVAQGASVFPLEQAGNGGIRVGDIVFVNEENVFADYSLHEVTGISANSISVATGAERAWQAGTQVHPVRKARLTEQPTFKRETDALIKASASFMVMQKNDDVALSVVKNAAGALDAQFSTYDSYYVMTSEPDERESLDVGFERMVDSSDNQVSFPRYRDTAGIPLSIQKHSKTMDGRAEYSNFRTLLYYLRGRASIVWLPTFSADLIPLLDTPAGQAYLTVANLGFTASGGVASGRQDICIFFADGSHAFRRINTSAVDGDGREVFALNAAFPSGLKVDDVVRISFMRLSRLNQDRVEIAHVTDTRGLSIGTMAFRFAPNIRQVAGGF